MSSSDTKIITVIGSGLIGRSWAMVFASGGYSVKIYDNQPGQSTKAIVEIKKQLQELEDAQMLRGEATALQQVALISSYDDLSQALEGAFFVQECVFEQLEVKQSIFQDIERLVGKDVILSSSTSCLVPSNVFSKVQNRSRCLVSHPVNPPYYVKLVELVPHPETAPAVMDTTHTLMTKVGQAPVRLRKEIDGFALNRVQAAIIAESWRLVQIFQSSPLRKPVPLDLSRWHPISTFCAEEESTNTEPDGKNWLTEKVDDYCCDIY
ncbi:lambda-crystallin homolog isoform X2 [Amphiprion ocellaris]|uniref:lambda-crystallin homolog isoform X2 n=1 Tax=Amphiprion ocellaris TaxID=80972 RepID=UPI0024112A85|nr:lambda-crystallin homolog isoform X2 [Amphiprion ocellaris]